MKRKIMSLGICLAGCVCLYAQQEDDPETNELDEVVVTDSRFSLKREHSGKAVIKIDHEELEKKQGQTLAEIINSRSGIEINGTRSNAGQNLGYFIRGGNNRKVLVLIDGVAVSDPSQINNDFDLRLLDTNQIESVEIIKGAASTLYGNAAAAAVINITTKKASKKVITASIRSSIGTNQNTENQDYNLSDFNNSIMLSGTNGKLSYNANLGHQHTSGLSAFIGDETDVFSKRNVLLGMKYIFNDNLSVDLKGTHDYIHAEIDGFSPVDFSRIDAADYFSKSEQNRITISPNYKYTYGSIAINASYLKAIRNIEDGFGANFNSERLTLDAYNKYTFNESVYTVIGLSYSQDKTTFNELQKITMVDPYLNAVWVSDFGITLNAGGRLNNHSEYGSHFTYNLNPSYVFKFGSDYLKIYGSYSSSFIAPSLYNLFGEFVANPELEPETNRTVELGLEYRNKDTRLSATVFNRKETDAIDYSTDSFTYINLAGDIDVSGLELETALRITDKLDFRGNYTFTERDDADVAFFPLVRIPKHKINTEISFEASEKTFLSVSYQYVGERSDASETLDSFSLIGFTGNHELIDNRLWIFLSAFNLLNEDYLEISGFTTKGRNIKLGFKMDI